MFSKFSEDAQKSLIVAKNEMTKLKHPYVGSEHLILAILSNDKLSITKKLNNLDITYKKFRDELVSIVGIGKNSNNWFLYTPLLKRIIENAIYDSKEHGDKKVSVERLFVSLLEEGDGVGIRILISMGVDIDSLYNAFNNKLLVKKNKKDKKLMVNDFAVNFNKKVIADEIDPVVCRDNEVERLIEILSRRCKNNPLLIGEAGVGKTAIVEELARRIVNGAVPKFLQDKIILSISISSMVAGTKYRGEFEERINKILKEVESEGNIILFIDEIHTIVGAGGAEGAIDASNILKPSLARGKIRIIGATTNTEYHTSIERDKALDRRFQKICVMEPNDDNTMKILKSLKPIYSNYHNVSIGDDILSYIIEMTNKYIIKGNNPDKSIDILDEVCAKASLLLTAHEKKIDKYSKQLKEIIKNKNNAVIEGNFKMAATYKTEQEKLENKLYKYNHNNDKKDAVVITKKMVDDIVEAKTKIPINKLNNNTLKFIERLQRQLIDKVAGQDDIIKELCKYTKLIKSGFSRNKPYSFMFLGSTGVGKTLLVKEYANNLYGKDNFIRIDLSEYKEEHSISKILGSPPGYVGYQDDNYILEKVRNNPHSVILLDEIEKAHPAIIKLFLQVLDEGIMHDSCGRSVNFRHTVIFMTSNLGMNKKKIGFSGTKDNSIMKKFFSIEFINRIDKIFEFNDLNYDDIKSIVLNKLKEIKNEYKKNNVDIAISKKLVDNIISKCNYEEYGARKVDKVIDDTIMNYILDMIIKKENKINIKELEV